MFSLSRVNGLPTPCQVCDFGNVYFWHGCNYFLRHLVLLACKGLGVSSKLAQALTFFMFNWGLIR